MNITRQSLTFFSFLAALLLAASIAWANPVTIADPSFENANLSPGQRTSDVSPWLETGGPNNGNAFKEWINGFATDGTGISCVIHSDWVPGKRPRHSCPGL